MKRFAILITVGISIGLSAVGADAASNVVDHDNWGEQKISGINVNKYYGYFPGVAICTKSGDYVIDLNPVGGASPTPGSNHSSVVNGYINTQCW